MAFVQTQFLSKALNLCSSVNVILPAADVRAQLREIPVVYLLHGYSDDHTMWMRRTSIERYAETICPEFAIVMPAIDHSFYTNMKRGNKYWTYVSQELPSLLGSMFPLSSKREDTFTTGLSMGGYGCLKLALNQPDRFLAVSSLSGACDMSLQIKQEGDNPQLNAEIINTFGTIDEFTGSENDLAHMAEVVAKAAVKPEIMLACGTKDFLYDNNVGFHKHLTDLGFPVVWDATPDRAHTWDYWDEKVQSALKWFVQLRNDAKGGSSSAENIQKAAMF